MQVVRREHSGMAGGTECLIWLTPRPDEDFPNRLLNELLAISSPVGLGNIEAASRRRDALNAIIIQGVGIASLNNHGERRSDESYYFDYVNGHRIKVFYYPNGIPVTGDETDEDMLYLLHKGQACIVSLEFEKSYGEGALENAVRLALM
ncbi:hypothetical protein MUU53_01675 [Rhizobium lemnae]|uniref:Uncharacterized protein n=1 Tax=Rhizobium lemnae TaxID=1214924 RepID=A0ABV8E4U2_9HYPH|nr:hypothetical protein [Rhizobium lemnae]MCJ8506615.1 hypothetical protein [Rhizobium lemnae]